MIVCDASPVIYLSKVGKLNFLEVKFEKVLLPKSAYEEIIKGKGIFREVDKVEGAIRLGWMEVIEFKDKEVSRLKTAFPNLGNGEIEAIVTARRKKLPMLLDDSYARRIAETIGIDAHGTIFVILKAFENKLVGKEDAIKLIDRLVESGFRVSVELYAKLISELRSF